MNAEFFILPSQTEAEYLQFIVQKIKTYYEADKTVVIYADMVLCQKFDHLLWFDQSDIFIPHFYVMKEDERQYIHLPVVLVSDAEYIKSIKKEIVMDLSTQSAGIFQHYQLLVAVVDQEPKRLNASRAQYKQLQCHGYQVHVHKV